MCQIIILFRLLLSGVKIDQLHRKILKQCTIWNQILKNIS